MRPKSLILLALALGCGLIASIGISQVLDTSNTVAIETTPIYVALKNINVGDAISDELVSLEEWPKDKVPVGAISKWEDLEDRRPRSNIYQGEALLDSKLLGKGQTNDPIKGVPEGMRLYTISVDARKSAAGLLSPGDRVDMQIFVNRNEQAGISSPFTKIFLQNIRVYAVDQTIDKANDGEEARNVAKTVSLIVTPQQASRITLAENLGEVSLIPRNPDDDKIVEDSEQQADDLLNRKSISNSREKEQLANDEESPVDSALSGLKSMMQNAMTSAAAAQAAATSPTAPAAPSFEMTILYPNETSRVQFTASGEPIVSGKPSAPPMSAPAVKSAGDGKPTSFPIDLQLK
jgi:pilus assembly protein CpaB